jgi:hypothetical protein
LAFFGKFAKKRWLKAGGCAKLKPLRAQRY